MQVHFHIHYLPNQGETLMLNGSAPETGSMQEADALEMQYLGDGYWHLPVEIDGYCELEYRYFLRKNGQTKRREWGENHKLVLPENADLITLYDHWQPESDTSFLYTSAYTDSLMAVEHHCQKSNFEPGRVILKVQATNVKKGQSIGISGNIEALGFWKDDKALKMQSDRFPEWCISLDAKSMPETMSYKFVVLDNATHQIVGWEWGEPRNLFIPRCMDRQMLMHSGMTYRFQEAPWKGAGVAIPVFSLRSDDGWGCGDFSDLKKMTDWAETTGQQMIQILPINDTSRTDTWRDSYPYNAISIYALHPIYASIKELPPLKNKKKMLLFEKERLKLNALTEVDYEKVMLLKTAYFQELFDSEGAKTLHSEGYLSFFEKNSDWLVPYAAFCYLRKKMDTFDFHEWGVYAHYDRKKIAELCDSLQPWHSEIALYYFVQYTLHLQLSSVRDYAHAHCVILKGDVPIGINRYSVEAWTESRLFNMDAQVGAPPDAFSIKGQNWGFPSYNWDQMKAENLNWWKRRFQKMADYFDAYRIDHILGFFRIWEIPLYSVEGLIGRFSPAIPLDKEYLYQAGFSFEEKTMTEPFITESLIKKLFGEEAARVAASYLEKTNTKRYALKPEVQTQKQIEQLLSETKKDLHLREGLFALCNEVLFVRDSKSSDFFHPRIAGKDTACYKSLSADQKIKFDKLYNDFFYVRNVHFWKQKALEILPALKDATRMLVCGEDLGMIPSSVPDVMHQLGILSLEIQRMPKAMGALFENLNAIPYQSVCTTSTHDMNPIRAWWMENPETTQQYYQQVLWKKGKAPESCSPEIAEEIIRSHLASPALWTVLPWQDWMSLDKKLSHPDPKTERINDPANPDQYWRYRMHIGLEQLLAETDFNEKVRNLIQHSGR